MVHEIVNCKIARMRPRGQLPGGFGRGLWGTWLRGDGATGLGVGAAWWGCVNTRLGRGGGPFAAKPTLIRGASLHHIVRRVHHRGDGAARQAAATAGCVAAHPGQPESSRHDSNACLLDGGLIRVRIGFARVLDAYVTWVYTARQQRLQHTGGGAEAASHSSAVQACLKRGTRVAPVCT